MSKRPIGRPKTGWEDDVLEDIKSTNIGNWKKVSQNKHSWKKVSEQAKNLYRLYSFLRRRILLTHTLIFKFNFSLKVAIT